MLNTGFLMKIIPLKRSLLQSFSLSLYYKNNNNKTTNDMKKGKNIKTVKITVPNERILNR